ncbi:metallophosphoesterase [Candidatus Woesearchaeota archaeon]|nr:metallophosphoesterase [Candidatus Woesearchaeota archaeon]
MMKILAAGDIHGDLIQLTNLINRGKSENVDALILCGDLSLLNNPIDNLLNEIKKSDLNIFIIPGNHEDSLTFEYIKSLGIKHLHSESTIIDDVGLFGCGFANCGMSMLTENQIFNYLNEAHNGISHLNKKIMITHVHPSESKMENFSSFVKGSLGVRRAISELKPDFLLCSHIHEAEGIEEKIEETSVINVGKNGKIIEF